MGREGVRVAVEVRAGEHCLGEHEDDERERGEDEREAPRGVHAAAERIDRGSGYGVGVNRTTTVPVICGWIEQM